MRPLPYTCGTRVKLKKGGFIQCDKPGVVVEVSHPPQEGSNRGFICRDHVRQCQESGLVVRILEGDDSYIRRRPYLEEKLAKYPCNICNRLFGEHSHKEFDDHLDQIEAPHVHLFKGTRAKKERIAHLKCGTCGRQFWQHSQQEYDACRNQDLKRNKPKQAHLSYVKCEICGYRFGDHSPEKFDACIDQIIENSV